MIVHRKKLTGLQERKDKAEAKGRDDEMAQKTISQNNRRRSRENEERVSKKTEAVKTSNNLVIFFGRSMWDLKI